MRFRRPLILASLAPVAAFSLLAAGCGGGSSPRVASVASTTTATTTTTQNGAAGFGVQFARCMRSNGVPSYPDPGSNGQVVKEPAQQLGVSESQFNAAANACDHFLPNGGETQATRQQLRVRLADMLSFARCMRGHGVANFPDPTPQDGITVEMVRAAGIDVHSPAVLQAAQACLPASHGALTPAKIREAISRAGG